MSLKDEAKAFFARAEIRENLVTLTEIASRIDVNISTVYTWWRKFGDFPEQLSPGRRGNSSYLAVYWWPDVQNFLKLHGLPMRRPVTTARRRRGDRQVNYGENLKRLAGSRKLLESQVKELFLARV